MAEAHLIAGLGNPGAKYDHTRHNIGFRVLEELALTWGGTWSEEKKFKARMSRAAVKGKTLHLCQPQTFMNLSGEAVGVVSDYYKITPTRVLVIVDDTERHLGKSVCGPVAEPAATTDSAQWSSIWPLRTIRVCGLG